MDLRSKSKKKSGSIVALLSTLGFPHGGGLVMVGVDAGVEHAMSTKYLKQDVVYGCVSSVCACKTQPL